MNKVFKIFILLFFQLGLLTGCATSGGQRTAKQDEVLQKVTQELAEEQLLDVWIELFEPGELPEDKDDASGLSLDIRKAEAYYIPFYLRGVMEKTGYWGAVRVVPKNTEGAELLVRGTIESSTGEELRLEVTALDASGREWFRKRYKAKLEAADYAGIQLPSDSFDALYHAIANDLAQFRDALTDAERTNIRQIAEMRFAIDMVPDAFSGYLGKDDKGRYTLLKLPAEVDPAYQRVQLVRERDFLFVDTLNGHFENFYREMAPPYLEWRKARSTEAAALREIKRKANTQKALGVAAILGAIAIEALGGRDTRASTGTVRDVMVIGGLYSIKMGMDTNAQSTIYQAAIEELGESFSSEAKPMVVEVDGETRELTGTAEAQYEQWRDIMRKIYASETGLAPLSSSTGVTE
ncbi:MAG: hypothetical protein U9N50_09805 [Pseudomonadota bacterium]|nr:hypothetical protein [Pseudomonadota bacterium]